jgi:hypothetical protein
MVQMANHGWWCHLWRSNNLTALLGHLTHAVYSNQQLLITCFNTVAPSWPVHAHPQIVHNFHPGPVLHMPRLPERSETMRSSPQFPARPCELREVEAKQNWFKPWPKRWNEKKSKLQTEHGLYYGCTDDFAVIRYPYNLGYCFVRTCPDTGIQTANQHNRFKKSRAIYITLYNYV